MSDPDTAAQDPIFWLHHANVDRLWEIWLRQGDRYNPDESQWLSQRFDLYDEDGRRVSMAVADVLDAVGQLGYIYSNLAVVPAEAVPIRPELIGVAMSNEPPPELVGASDRAVVLTGSPASTRLRVSAPTGPGAESLIPGRRRAYLHIENITGERNPGTAYGVYVNLPNEDLSDEERDQYLVGVVSFFGIKQASQPDPGARDQHGLHYAFDATGVVDRFGLQEGDEEAEMIVTFLPLEPPGTEETLQPHPEVSIGTVSMFYGR
jgi:tyrosinase